MSKEQSFKFTPAEWISDTALRTCSCAARGLWMDILCLMYEVPPYGQLKVGEKTILVPDSDRLAGEPVELVEGWLDELILAGVCSTDEHGCVVINPLQRGSEGAPKGGK